MICLECSLSPTTDRPLVAIGGCAYCGAGVCLDHARLVELRAQPAGVVPELRRGARRILCTTCFATTALDGAAVRTRIGRSDRAEKRVYAGQS